MVSPMEKTKGYVLAGLFAVIGMLAAGCEESDCPMSNASYASFGFYDENGELVKLKDTLSVITPLKGYDSLFAYYGPTDTIVSERPIDTLTTDKGYTLQMEYLRKMGTLINLRYGAERIELPLSYTATTDTFILTYSPRLADTLYVGHLNLPYFSSMECGTVMHYRLTHVSSTHHLIDSVEIAHPEITNTLQENVKIHYTINH